MKRKSRLTGRTIHKLHRLARELTALNHVRVKFLVVRDCLDSRRNCIFFEAVPAAGAEWWRFGACGGTTVQEALSDFYGVWGLVKHRKEEAEFLAADIPLEEAAYARPGIHGRTVIAGATDSTGKE